MAGILRPSICELEANYKLLKGNLSAGSYNKNGSELFNRKIMWHNSLEGNYLSNFNQNGCYVDLLIKDYCNIYGHISASYNTAENCTGKLQILQYDGSNYTIDVTNKYWVGKTFKYSNNTTSISNGLTFNEFLNKYLIDNHWEKMVSKLPPGQYRFKPIRLSTSGMGYYTQRRDNEWFLEKVFPCSEKIKLLTKNIILNNELFKKYSIPIEKE